jgi:hypothetical protein
LQLSAPADNPHISSVTDARDIWLGSWDGDPVLWRPGEAWMVPDGSDRWIEINSTIAAGNTRVLSRDHFAAKFRSLPPLPKEAFTT